jgi:hypothetical protein
LIVFAGIGAVVSEGNPQGVAETVDNILRHQQVVNRTFAVSRSVIPCRFGMWMADEARVIALLRKNAIQLEACLAQLEDKVEVEIKAIFDGQQERKMPPTNLTTGEKYLLVKRKQYHSVERLSEQGHRLSRELNQATSPFWVAVKIEEAAFRQQRLLRLFYLVEREKLGFFKRTYERACQKTPQRKLLYTGPWPPYSFTEVTLV